jgi:hypothetical protein
MSWRSRLRDAVSSLTGRRRRTPTTRTPSIPRTPSPPRSTPGPPRTSPADMYTPDAPRELVGDPVVGAMIQDAWLNPDVDADLRVQLRQGLRVYVFQMYGVQFDDIFDWDAWREAYGEAS